MEIGSILVGASVVGAVLLILKQQIDWVQRQRIISRRMQGLRSYRRIR